MRKPRRFPQKIREHDRQMAYFEKLRAACVPASEGLAMLESAPDVAPDKEDAAPKKRGASPRSTHVRK
jgi:hypothetical protein